jgi:hypothetical protein
MVASSDPAMQFALGDLVTDLDDPSRLRRDGPPHVPG